MSYGASRPGAGESTFLARGQAPAAGGAPPPRQTGKVALTMPPLSHPSAGGQSDDALAEEATKHLAASPALQLVAELLQRLRAMSVAWWSPESLRARWSASERMQWLAQRPNLASA